MDRTTVDVYEQRASEWHARRPPRLADRARAFARRVPRGRVRADLGCGPGSYSGLVGEPVVALDAAGAMLDLVPEQAPNALRVQADLESLPFRRGVLHGGWARASYLHVPRQRLPLALAHLHHATALDAPIEMTLHRGDDDFTTLERDDFPGRSFAGWEPDDLRDVVVGAGFTLDDLTADTDWLTVRARRARTLPDTVGPDMRLLVCGLNPSLYAADAGIAFARPGNRFWPAATRAGIVTRPRDPSAVLRVDRVGMTDLVKRATVGASELHAGEYGDGLARVTRLVRRHRPGAVCFVGLAGWRAAVDRSAVAGVQPETLDGTPVYVMPNTSGLNAHSQVPDLAEHLRAAAALAG